MVNEEKDIKVEDESKEDKSVREIIEDHGKKVEKEEKKDAKEDTSKEESDQDDEETAQAIKILRLLNDPVKGKIFVQNLAKEYGLESVTDKKIEKNIKSILKDKLGDDYNTGHDAIADILEATVAALSNKVDSALGSIEERSSKASLMTEFDRFIGENKVTEKEQRQMDALVKDMPPNPNSKVSLSRYLSNILKIVRPASSRNESEGDVRDNLRRRVENLSSDTDEITSIVRVGRKPVSARDAVLAAAKGIKLER